MKKFLCIPLALIMFTACTHNAENTEHVSAVPTETVTLPPETVTTLFIPEPLPEPVPEPVKIEFAVFDPFADSEKVTENVYSELYDAACAISESILMSNGDAPFLENYTEYSIHASDEAYLLYDETKPVEGNELEEYAYYALNTNYAADEEALFTRFRERFTENYISDGDLRSKLFDSEDNGLYNRIPPLYKTIDGVLCAKSQYMGVPVIMTPQTGIAVKKYDGNSADIVLSGHDVAAPMWHIFMKLKKSDEYGWQLDGIEYKNYWSEETDLLYSALYLRQDKLNAILGGGSAPENADEITVGGVKYVETDLDMTIDEMRSFFAGMFRGKVAYLPNDFQNILNDGNNLREAYTQKFIDDVYIERDGKLYRKADAPRWYLPELRIDPYGGVKSAMGGGAPEDLIIMDQPFYDSVTDTEFTSEIKIVYNRIFVWGQPVEEQELEFLYIASELPIKEYK